MSAGAGGPWWVTLLDHGARRWLLRFKFDAEGGLAAAIADPLDHDEAAPTAALIAEAERFRSRNCDIIAGALALAAGPPRCRRLGG